MGYQGVQIDDREVQQMLSRLDAKSLRKVTKSAFKQGAGVILRQAQRNYKALFPGSDLHCALVAMPWKSGLGAWVKKLGKRSKKKRDKMREKYGDVFSRAYVLDILERGSGERQSRGRSQVKLGRRGRVKAYRFFFSAVSSTERKALDKVLIAIKKHLEKMSK